MATPSIKVTYFNGAGRAEAMRVLLHLAGIDFEDERIAGVDWPTVKPTMPLGQMPVLTVDGKPHTQSMAGARYAAKLAKVYPEDPLQALKVDEFVEIVSELSLIVPKGGDDLKEKREQWVETTLKKYLAYLNAHFEASTSGWIVDDFTWGDLIVAGLCQAIQSGTWDHVQASVLTGYPALLQHAGKVAASDAVKNWQAFYASKKAEAEAK
eukprot:m.59193 g.59193  ORF g.59193 m.59193 type:complete len:210 (-) comp11756_c1_seq2:115-744(-)